MLVLPHDLFIIDHLQIKIKTFELHLKDLNENRWFVRCCVLYTVIFVPLNVSIQLIITLHLLYFSSL